MEEGHAVNHKVVLGEFEIVGFFSFVFVFFDDQSERKSAFFCAFFSDVVKGEESSIVGEYHSVLEIVWNLSDLDDLNRFVFD